MNSGPNHLEQHYDAKRQATVKLVKQAIQALTKEGRTVSLAAIREKAIRPDGRHISESSVTRNEKAYELYLKASRIQPKPRSPALRWLLKDVSEKERPLEKKALEALRKMSKTELVLLARRLTKDCDRLTEQLKVVRATKLDNAVPKHVRVLRPVGAVNRERAE